MKNLDNAELAAEEAKEAAALKQDRYPELGRLQSSLMPRQPSERHLISRARRQKSVLASERSALFGHEEARQLAMLQRLQALIERKTADAQSGLVRTMTATFDKRALRTLLALEDGEDVEAAMEAKLAAAGGAAASGGSGDKGSDWRMPSFADLYEEESSDEEGDAMPAGGLFTGAIARARTLADAMAQRDFALGKLTVYQGKASAGEVLACCGYSSTAAFDKQSFTIRYAQKKSRGKPAVADMLAEPAQHRYDALVRLLRSSTRYEDHLARRRPAA